GFEGAGEYPGLAGERQTLGGFSFALPVHTELAQLRFHLASTLGIAWHIEIIAQRARGLFIEALDLTQIEPVGADDRLQAAKTIGQTLRTGASNERNIQFVEQLGQGCAGSEFRMDIALLLQLNAAPAQLLDDLLIVLVLKEAVDLVGD